MTDIANDASHFPGAPLVLVLDQLKFVVERLTDEQYIQGAGFVSSGIGPHLRHCLDHVEALLNGLETGKVDYDHRDRGTPVEKVRAEGLAKIDRMSAGLMQISEAQLDQPVDVIVYLSGEESSETTARSSVRRELGFLINHTVHHNAIITVVANHLDVELPEHFGLAPSTIIYLKKEAEG